VIAENTPKILGEYFLPHPIDSTYTTVASMLMSSRRFDVATHHTSNIIAALTVVHGMMSMSSHVLVSKI